MSEADGIRAEVNSALDDLADSVNLVAELEKKIEAISGTILLIGLTDNRDQAIAGSTHLAAMAKSEAETVLNYLFELRQRLTLYRDRP